MQVYTRYQAYITHVPASRAESDVRVARFRREYMQHLWDVGASTDKKGSRYAGHAGEFFLSSRDEGK